MDFSDVLLFAQENHYAAHAQANQSKPQAEVGFIAGFGCAGLRSSGQGTGFVGAA